MRGVFFNYVDLRWGITEEQTKDGKTIAICLQEVWTCFSNPIFIQSNLNRLLQIDRCRPYFLCMMGERFGWSQQEDSPDELLNNSFDFALQNFPHQLGWLEKHRYGTSVTQVA
jgi:hypothetical protein